MMGSMGMGAGMLIKPTQRKHERRWSFDAGTEHPRDSLDKKKKAPAPKVPVKEVPAKSAPKKLVPAEMSNDAQKRQLALSKFSAEGLLRFGKETKSIVVKGSDPTEKFRLTYGWSTQTGYYGANANNQNQDNLVISESFGGDPDRALFGVFDGHGMYGAHCSTFAVGAIEENIKNSAGFKHGDIGHAFADAFPKISDDLHKMRFNRDAEKDPLYINDNRSGSTAICVFIDHGVLTVANVGDSRAIIGEAIDDLDGDENTDTDNTSKRSIGGTDKNDKFKPHVAMPLSIDQTCFRADERARCREAGAVIMTISQMDGTKPFDPESSSFGTEEDGGDDPPRLWIKGRRDPGAAFTRSLGDTIGSKYVGVIPEPEILIRKLTVYDRFIVIASDGVFEFMTSQTVINIVSKFKDPQEASRALVAEAYRLWLQYDVRTDDITAIVIFITPVVHDLTQGGMPASPRIPRNLRANMLKNIAGSFRDMNTLTLLQRENRPVRRNSIFVKGMLQSMVEGEALEEGDISRRGRDNIVTKSLMERAELQQALSASFLFNHLNMAQVNNIIDGFEKVDVAPGETVIQQGDVGTLFFVVITGVYDCYVTDANGDKKLVKTYRETDSDGLQGNPSFGELALVRGTTRAATVQSKTAGTLWVVGYPRLARNLTRMPNSEMLRVLRLLPFISNLARHRVQQLADMCAQAVYDKGTVICKQGEYQPDEQFYILIKGDVALTRPQGVPTGSPPNTPLEGKLKAISYFGEHHILTGDVHDWSVTVSSESAECLCIASQAFREVIRGSVLEKIKAHSAHKGLQIVVIKEEIPSTRRSFQIKDVKAIKVVQKKKSGPQKKSSRSPKPKDNKKGSGCVVM